MITRMAIFKEVLKYLLGDVENVDDFSANKN